MSARPSVVEPGLRQAPRRHTSATLSAGVAVAAIAFAVALLSEVAGTDAGSGEMTDLAAVLEGLLALSPWAWSSVGVYVVVLTPVAGLVVTAWEFASVGDRRTVTLALAVIGVLVVSAVVSLLR